ncbi:MAG: isopentenyl-diphosphate delta-isomerase [Saprospiraceae bacterium]
MSDTSTIPPQAATPDPTAESRKADHIELAFKSRVEADQLDRRFYYEPLLSAHPQPGSLPCVEVGGRVLRTPIWVSSMTGGAAMAGVINRNLARACGEFGMGMGLGSCRQLLHGRTHFADFDVRDLIGPDQPLYANLGIAQLETLLDEGAADQLSELVGTLRADGLIIHVNPLQEAMQPEGDVFRRPPIETIQQILERCGGLRLIVKEVGQGFGPESLRALLRLPLEALEFAAAGGANFARLELLRSDVQKQRIFGKIASVGHSAGEMLEFVRQIVQTDVVRTRSLILSGGVGDFLDGYYLLRRSPLPAAYGQASGLLAHAQGDYAELRAFVEAQIRGLELAFAYLHVRDC